MRRGPADLVRVEAVRAFQTAREGRRCAGERFFVAKRRLALLRDRKRLVRAVCAADRREDAL